MKKRRFKSKGLTPAERRQSLDAFILTETDEPSLPAWWSTLTAQSQPIRLADATPAQAAAIFRGINANNQGA